MEYYGNILCVTAREPLVLSETTISNYLNKPKNRILILFKCLLSYVLLTIYCSINLLFTVKYY